MAADNELQIVLSLIDNASTQLKKITGDIKKDTDSISKESEKATKTLGQGMKEAGKGLKDFRREMFVVTASIAAIGVAVNEWGKHNYETKQALDSIQVSVKSLTASIGSLFVPIVIQAASALKGILGIINPVIKAINELQVSVYQIYAALAGFGKGISGIFKGENPIEAFKKGIVEATDAYKKFGEEARKALVENIPQISEAQIKMKETNEILQRGILLYLDGKISAQAYYEEMTSGEVALWQNMNTRLSLMQQLAVEENLMRSQSLMNYKADVDAKMGLLKTLESYHHTAYSSMMDFTNMFIQKFSTGMTTALTSIIMGTKKASEAFKEFGIALVTAIVEFVIQYGIQMLIAAALSKLIMASTIAQATAISAAWLPAAIFASIATLGGADAAGMSAFAAATGAGLAIGGAAIIASKAIGFGGGATGGTGAGGGFAEGGWVGLNGPQMALVGERGPEYIVPNNRLGNMGNQTSIHIEINNPTVRSDEDIDKLTEEISMRLAREADRI